MLGIRSLLTLAAVALPALAAAQEEEAPIACVYAGVDRNDAFAAIAAQNEREREPTAEEEAAMDRLADHAGACQARLGWTDRQTVSALAYAFSRFTYEREVQALVTRGLHPSFIENVRDALGEQGMAMLMAGEDTPENLELVGDIVSRELLAAGYRIPKGSAEWRAIGGHIGRGLSARVALDREVAAFGRE